MNESGPSVLVVEDDERIQYLLETLLESHCSELCVATDGHEAMSLLQSRPFDRVICDLRIPGPDGLAITKSIAEAHPATRVLIISGFLEPEVEAQLVGLGARCLPKPFRIADIRSFVADVPDSPDE